jgi:drug/metabolite transporter (DMT)-like permease
MAIALSILSFKGATLDNAGVGYAVASGALASGIGYSIWYMALPALKATSAAIVQLCAPVIAALGGLVLLGEPISLRLAVACVAILGGIALAILEKQNGNFAD